MPRSGALAIGAVIVALAGEIAGRLAPAAATILLAIATASLVASHLRRPPVGGRGVGRRGSGTGPLDSRTALFVAAGAVVMTIRLAAAGLEPPAQAPLPRGDGPWVANVEVTWTPRDGQQLGRVRIALSDDAAVVLLATLPRFPDVIPGDAIRVRGPIRAFGDDERGDSLRSSGMVGSLRAVSLEILRPPAGPGRVLESIRRGAGDAVARALPEPAAGLAAGILIGLRDRVDRGVAADFTTAGVSHIVAISGWNIAIVAAGVGAMGGRLHRRRRSLLIAVAIAVYVAFAGASPAVLRAGAMAGVVLIARESARPTRAAIALGWAVLVLLLADPSLIGDAGFQLSTAATAGLIAWATPLGDRLAGRDPGRLRSWLAESLGISLAAQAATLPLVLLAFGRLSLVAPAINLVVVPLVPPAMAASVLALIGGIAVSAGLPGVVASSAGLPAWLLLTAIIEAVRVAAAIPLASILLEPPAHLVGAAVAAGSLWLVPRSIRALGQIGVASAGKALTAKVPTARSPADRGNHEPANRDGAAVKRRPRYGRIVAIGLSISVLATAIAIVQRPTGLASVTVLDVGQGDAILVEGGRGGRLLVDGGPDPERLLVALDERLPPWDRRIDVIVLTHPHEDHVAGLVALLGRFAVGATLATPMLGPGPGYAAWEERLASLPVSRGILATGAQLRIDDVRLRVLWPDEGSVPTAPPDSGTGINNASIVLLGEVEGRRFLLTGDIEDGIDPELVRRGLPAVDLLKVAHHGSRTASTEAFLNATHPTIAIASAGATNRYGHPAPATMERLAEIARRVYRTDRDGSVTVSLGRDRMKVRTSGPRASGAPDGADRLLADAGVASRTPAFAIDARFSCAIPAAPIVAARIGAPVDLLYHRLDGRTGEARLPARPGRAGSPARLVLGRRRLRAGQRDGSRSGTYGRTPGVGTRALADPGRRSVGGPDDRPADRTARDRLDVRCRDPGRRDRRRPAGEAWC